MEPGAGSNLAILHYGACVMTHDMAAEGNPHPVPNTTEQMVIVAARAIQK